MRKQKAEVIGMPVIALQSFQWAEIADHRITVHNNHQRIYRHGRLTAIVPAPWWHRQPSRAT